MTLPMQTVIRRSTVIVPLSRWIAPLLFSVSASAWCAEPPPSASADPSSRAQTLFDTARAQLRQSNFAQACPLFEQSYHLEPALGTLINLATCREKEGKYASSLNAYFTVLLQAEARGDLARQAIAAERIAALRTMTSSVVVRLPSTLDPDSVTCTIDGVPVLAAELNKPIPMDGGSHELVVNRVSYPEFRAQFDLAPRGEQHVLDVPHATATVRASVESRRETVRDASKERSAVGYRAADDVATRRPPQVAVTAASTSNQADRASPNDARIIALSLAGLGAASFLVAGYYAVSAYRLDQRSTDQGCNAADVCPLPALNTRNEAIRAGNIATIATIAGGLLGASGLGLYLWSGTRSQARATVVSQPNAAIAVHVVGRF